MPSGPASTRLAASARETVACSGTTAMTGTEPPCWLLLASLMASEVAADCLLVPCRSTISSHHCSFLDMRVYALASCPYQSECLLQVSHAIGPGLWM